MTRVYINLPVDDLERSTAFYEAIGGTRNDAFSNDKAAAIVLGESIYVMLLTHGFYRTFTTKELADPHRTSSVLLALSCDSPTDVDRMVERAAAAGGKADPGPRQDHGFMYGRSFEDPDGHHWEPHWMDPKAAGQGADASARQEC